MKLGTKQQRREALAPMTQYGPSYNRNVVSALSDFDLWEGRGEAAYAELALLLAEMRAGLMSWEEYEARSAAVVQAYTANR